MLLESKTNVVHHRHKRRAHQFQIVVNDLEITCLLITEQFYLHVRVFFVLPFFLVSVFIYLFIFSVIWPVGSVV